MDVKLGDLVLGMTSYWQIENYLELKTGSRPVESKKDSPARKEDRGKSSENKKTRKPTNKSKKGTTSKARGRKKTNK